MKKLIITIAIGAFALVGTATNTEASPHCGQGYNTPANTIYVSGYRHGRPVYTEKIFVGYDCHGRPRFTYRQVYVQERQHPQSCRPTYSEYQNGEYQNGGYQNGRYSQNNQGCSGGSTGFSFRR